METQSRLARVQCRRRIVCSDPLVVDCALRLSSRCSNLMRGRLNESALIFQAKFLLVSHTSDAQSLAARCPLPGVPLCRNPDAVVAFSHTKSVLCSSDVSASHASNRDCIRVKLREHRRTFLRRAAVDGLENALHSPTSCRHLLSLTVTTKVSLGYLPNVIIRLENQQTHIRHRKDTTESAEDHRTRDRHTRMGQFDE